MGQKVNPIGFRLAVSKDWRSKWYAPEKEFADSLHSDLAIRAFLKEKLSAAALSKIVIERAWNQVRVTLHTARPGLVIGRKGQEIDVMSQKISEMCGGKQVKIDIFEIKHPELDAQLVAETVAVQLERRISFRRAMKRAVQTAMDMGADGIRIRCAGRLGGADIARAEWYRQGKVPLQTLRIPIDYGTTEAKTVYGVIGVKCWLNRGNAGEGGVTRPQGERRPRREREDRGAPGPGGIGPRGGVGQRGRRAPTPAPEAPPVDVPEAAAE
ncbi:MAG: 30S ribosomal protein S3 [Verrucomicrobiaceae bacterium]|nr:30S ribosomal protein S3 [Verrucomicrobiaceae bacterium]